MWKQLVDFGNKLISLMRRVQKLEEDYNRDPAGVEGSSSGYQRA
jgi:hypothetical protein